MVIIDDMGPEMFWGITMDEGKKYTQTAESAFHISMAALEPVEGNHKDIASVMLVHNGAEFLLCTLKQGSLYQQALDLNFSEGESLTLFCTGKGTVHLSGYKISDQEDEMDDEMGLEGEDSDMSEDISDDDAPELIAPPAKKQKKMAAAAALDEVDSDDDDSDEDESFLLGLGESDDEDDSDEDDDDDDDSEDDSEDDDDSDEDEIPVPAPQQKKQSPAQANGKQTTPGKKDKSSPNTPTQRNTKQDKTTPKQEQKTPKQEQKTPKQENKTPQGGATPQKRKLPSDVVIEDLKVGHGPDAKTNRMVHMLYVGKLQNGKIFDQTKSGKAFKFRLGKGEVIKGWEVGIQGMKVGGKRRLTIPPNMGYGKEKQGPIPSNSTLVFDVELKSIS